MLLHHFRSFFRSLRRNGLVSIVNITGLSIGMTAAVLILLWVQNETSYDDFYPDAGRIYRVTNHITITKTDTWIWEDSPLLLAESAEKDIPGIQGTTRLFTGNGPVLQAGDRLFREKNLAYVDSGWFSLFPSTFIAGNAAAFPDHPHSMILTASTAKKYFGSAEALGQIIRIDTVSYQVRGVVADPPLNASFRFDLFMPIGARVSGPGQEKYDRDWGNFICMTFLRLDKNAQPASVARQLTAMLNGHQNGGKVWTTLQPLQEMHFETQLQSSRIVHNDRRSVYIFSGLAALLLLIACINYVNLTTARAGLRVREVSVRKIVGAGRRQLFGRFIAESVRVSAVALLISLLLVWLSLPLLRQLTGQDFTFTPDSPVLWKILPGTLVLTSILNGIYPALLLSSFSPLQILRGAGILRIRGVAFRKILVVGQFTIAIVLVLGTIVANRQLHFIQRTTGGYDRSQIMEIGIPVSYFAHDHYDRKKMKALSEAFRQDLSSRSSFSQVVTASESIVNLTTMGSGGFDWDGRQKDFKPSLTRLSADAGFARMFNLALTDGRWFRRATRTTIRTWY